jgi:hypothetical protein
MGDEIDFVAVEMLILKRRYPEFTITPVYNKKNQVKLYKVQRHVSASKGITPDERESVIKELEQ